jgi:hypothetical protein
MSETTYFQCESEINARKDLENDESAKQVLIDDECKKKILEPLIGTKQLTTLLGDKYQVMKLTTTLLAGGETDKEIVEAKDYFTNSSGTKLHENGEAFNTDNKNNYVFKLLELAKVPVETQQKWDFNKKLENKYEEEIKAALQEKMDGGRKKRRSRRSRKGGRRSRRKTRRGGKRRIYRHLAVKAFLKKTKRRRKKKKTNKKKKRKQRTKRRR